MTASDGAPTGAPASEPAGTRFPRLFEPCRVGGLTLKNRLVFGPHGSRFVDPHSLHLTERQAEYFAERARGGVGMIIQGSGMVHPTGLATAGINEVWDDACIPSYRMVAEAVHEHNCVIFGQLSHLGRQGNTFANHRELWAPSALPDPASRVVPHAMTRRDMVELVDGFRSGAARYLRAGFDGIEVYLAHGYLLCEFLSEFSNHRTDDYGGCVENRIRLPLQVLQAVRDEVGAHVPVGIRVSADEFSPKGLTVDQVKDVVTRLLAAVQVDYVSVSQSNYASIETMIPDMSFPREPFVHYARAVREVTDGVPVMTVGRIIDPDRCEALLSDGTADLVIMVRPLIADPEYPNKVLRGDADDIRECISCNVGCRGGPHRGLPIACLVNPSIGFERTAGFGRLGKAANPKDILVIGGGPAGLKTAETAAERGHRVRVVESSERLGGQVLLAAQAMPYRDEFANSVRFLERRLVRLGVEVTTCRRGDAALVEEIDPDAVVLATGSRPGRPPIPGVDLPHVSTIHDVLTVGAPQGSVVVIDSGESDWKCLTVVERLAAEGCHVRLVSPIPVGAEIDVFSRPPLLRRLRRAGVSFLEYATATAIEEHRVRIRDSHTGEESWLEDVDAVVLSWFGVASDELYDDLLVAGRELHVVGDSLAPRRAIDAIWDGFRVGRQL